MVNLGKCSREKIVTTENKWIWHHHTYNPHFKTMTTRQLLRFKSRNLSVDLQELYENEISDSIAKSLEIWRTQTSLWWRTKFKLTRHVGNGLQMFVSGQVKGLYLVQKNYHIFSSLWLQKGAFQVKLRWISGQSMYFFASKFRKTIPVEVFPHNASFVHSTWMNYVKLSVKENMTVVNFPAPSGDKMTKHRIFRPKGSLSSLFIWFADIFPRLSGFTICTEGW